MNFEIHLRLCSYSKQQSHIDVSEFDLKYNAASLPNPPHALRKKHNGKNKDLQKELFKNKKVLLFYDKCVADILEKIEEKKQMILKQSAQTDSDLRKINSSEITAEMFDEDYKEERISTEIDSIESNNDIEYFDNEIQNEDKKTKFILLQVAVGCHAGKHRSVAIVDRLSKNEILKEIITKCVVIHVDI